MSIVNFKNNPFNNSNYSDAEKNGDVGSINPLVDGEPRTAEILNRPSNFDWGRTEVLKESVEALWAELLVRKFSVEAIARLWTGYYYNNNGTETFVPGKILIPANTSLKIIGYALPQWGELSGSTEYYQYPVIGILFDKSKGAYITIRFRHNATSPILEEYRADASNTGIKNGHEIIFKMVLGPNSQTNSVEVTNVSINDKYAVFTLSLKDGANIKPSDIASALNNSTSASPYIAGIFSSDGSLTNGVIASSLVGTIKSGETIASYDSIPDTDSSVHFYNRAPVSRYEIDIPASVLSNFFSDKTMSPGDVLFVSIPQNNNIPRDGSILREVQNRQHIGQYTTVTVNDLLIYSRSLNNYNVTKLSPTNHLLIPIVRINAPYADNYNQIETISNGGSNEEILRNKLFYAEFIDGVKVYPGKWHYDINEEDEGALSFMNFQCPLTSYHKEDLQLINLGSGESFGDGSSYGNSYIRLASNNNYYYENKDYLLVRGVSNNIATIIKINGELANSDTAYFTFAKVLQIESGKIKAIGTQEVTNPSTVTVSSSKIPHWNNGETLLKALERIEEHRLIGTQYGHANNTVPGAAIKDHEITANKISSSNDTWIFNGELKAECSVSKTYPPIKLGNTYWNSSDIPGSLGNFAISLIGPALLGIESFADGVNKVGGLAIRMPFSCSSNYIGYIVRFDSITTSMLPCESTNGDKAVGIALNGGVSSIPLLVYGVCYVKVDSSATFTTAGTLLTIGSTSGCVKEVGTSTFTVGIALSAPSNGFVYMLYWGYRKT